MSKKLTAVCVKISDLKAHEIQEMFKLMGDYYANVTHDQFKSDLLKKDYVFLMRDPSKPDIKGFSTIVSIDAQLADKKHAGKSRSVRGCFSGDTVIHRDYWGNAALQVSFLKFLFMQKLKKPFSPLYWFLISKGYKTYLLMANNFGEHYPRYERTTPPEMQALLDTFALHLYPETYSRELGTISAPPDQAKDRLKTEIAPICENLLATNPRVSFFVERNPGWKQGDELACIAEMTFMMPVKYQLKVVQKRLSKLLPGLKPASLPSSGREEGAAT